MKNFFYLNALVISICVYLLSGCSGPKPFGESEKKAVGDTITRLMSEITRSVEKLDTENIFKWLSDDSTAVFASGGMTYSRTGISSMFTDYYSKLKGQSYRPLQEQVIVFSPDAAAWIAVLSGYMIAPDNSRQDEYLTETWLWQRESSGWRVVHYHESYLNMPSAARKTMTETALTALAKQLEGKIPTEKEMPSILRAFLEKHPGIYGSTLAFAPYDEEGSKHVASPYIYRSKEGFVQVELPEHYDYTQSHWYKDPVERNVPGWSMPYYDGGGGGVVMITYSIPLHDQTGKVAGVLTADLDIR